MIDTSQKKGYLTMPEFRNRQRCSVYCHYYNRPKSPNHVCDGIQAPVMNTAAAPTIPEKKP